MTGTPPISDIQFYIFACEVPIAVAAKRMGTSPSRLLKELAETPVPPWLAPAARRVLTGTPS